MRTHITIAKAALIVCVLIGSSQGCDGGNWYERHNWVAKEVFDDAKVIELCGAIERNDLIAAKQLVSDGVDVNAVGDGGVTPLLWTIPGDKLQIMQLLLQAGANPNVMVMGYDAVHRAGIHNGSSVTHYACRTVRSSIFELVFSHGGDVGLLNPTNGDDPLSVVIKGSAPDKSQRLNKLIELGACPDGYGESVFPPAYLAVVWFRQYDLAIQLLTAGADPLITKQGSSMNLIHGISRAKRYLDNMKEAEKAGHQRLVDWLVTHGFDVEAAEQQLIAWERN